MRGTRPGPCEPGKPHDRLWYKRRVSTNDSPWTQPSAFDSSSAPIPQPPTGAPVTGVPGPSTNVFAAPSSVPNPIARPNDPGAASTVSSKRGWFIVLSILAFLIVILLLLGYFFRPWGSTPREEKNGPQGYAGSATNTGNLSSAWAAGIGTAWTLDSVSAVRGEHQEVVTLVDGTTLYVAGTPSSHEGIDVAAVDISGSQPQVIWDSSDPQARRDSSRLPLRMTSVGDKLIVGNYTVDKATGEVQEAPWIDDSPLTAVGDILVTCSGAETCAGWTWESSEWKQQWKSITTLQDTSNKIWDMRDSLVVGSGDDTSVLAPVQDRRSLQLINVHTGTVATLGDSVRMERSGYRRDVLVASDGVAIRDNNDLVSFYDASGTLVNSFEVTRYLSAIADGGQAPTLEELQAYLKSGKAPWATGMIEASGPKCEDVTVSPTSAGSSRIVHKAKGLAVSSSDPCYTDIDEVRMSADGAAVYVSNGNSTEIEHAYFLDTDGDVVHAATDMVKADQLTWAFDDLIIAVSKGQVTAFTPASA